MFRTRPGLKLSSELTVFGPVVDRERFVEVWEFLGQAQGWICTIVVRIRVRVWVRVRYAVAPRLWVNISCLGHG